MKNEHTPGPWKVVAGDGTYSVEGPASDFMYLRNEADARLISASPEFLFACTEIETHLDALMALLATHQDNRGNPEDSSYLMHESKALVSASKFIRAAITKATGGAV